MLYDILFASRKIYVTAWTTYVRYGIVELDHGFNSCGSDGTAESIGVRPRSVNADNIVGCTLSCLMSSAIFGG